MEKAVKSPTKTHHNAGKRWGRPFLPGNNANPLGRPTNPESITVLCRARLMEILPDGRTRADHIADKWIADLEIGNCRDRGAILKELLDRVEGKVKDRVEVELTGQVEIKTVEVRLPG